MINKIRLYVLLLSKKIHFYMSMDVSRCFKPSAGNVALNMVNSKFLVLELQPLGNFTELKC